MAYDIWARATSKWRGIVVYVLLQAAMRFVTQVIIMEAPSRGYHLYASLAGLATSIYCLISLGRLLLRDEPGDENWPPLWS